MTSIVLAIIILFSIIILWLAACAFLVGKYNLDYYVILRYSRIKVDYAEYTQDGGVFYEYNNLRIYLNPDIKAKIEVE